MLKLTFIGCIRQPPYRRPATNVYKVLKSEFCHVWDLSTLAISLKFVLVDTHGCYLDEITIPSQQTIESRDIYCIRHLIDVGSIKAYTRINTP